MTGFAIKNDDLWRKRGHDQGDPVTESLLEIFRIDQAEQTTQGVVRRNAMRQLQKAPEPLHALFGPEFDFHEGIPPPASTAQIATTSVSTRS